MLGKSDRSDELRLCPACRMSISVWATKCHYCGQKVSRPRKDEAKFTLNDLGGDISDEHQVSSDVMSALEQFREEEETRLEKKHRQEAAAKKVGWFKRPQPPVEDHASASGLDDGLPQLDDEHRNLAELVSDKPYQAPMNSARTPSRPLQPSLPWEKIFVGAGIALALMLMFFLIDIVGPKVLAYFRNRDPGEIVIYTNRALSMLESGASSIEALEEAAEARGFVNSQENQAILAQVRQRFKEDIDVLLRRDPWRQSQLDEASKLINRALEVDSDPIIQDLMGRVNRELAAYKMVLKSIDVANGKAFFILHNPYYEKSEESGGPGDYIQERFIIKGITGSMVRLEDTRVSTTKGYRKLLARPLAPLIAE